MNSTIIDFKHKLNNVEFIFLRKSLHKDGEKSYSHTSIRGHTWCCKDTNGKQIKKLVMHELDSWGNSTWAKVLFGKGFGDQGTYFDYTKKTST
jgi:hypothetical protein